MGISMKFRSIQQIKNQIVEAIDSNQEIKRYIKYLTDSPLASRAKLDNGKFIDQPDITESLVGKNIIPTMYMESCLEDNMCIIFIYPYRGDLSGKTLGDNYINIDVLVPTVKDILEDLGEQRTFAICNAICNTLDDVKLNKGMTTLNFVNYVVERVSKDSEYTVISLQGIISTSNMRAR